MAKCCYLNLQGSEFISGQSGVHAVCRLNLSIAFHTMYFTPLSVKSFGVVYCWLADCMGHTYNEAGDSNMLDIDPWYYFSWSSELFHSKLFLLTGTICRETS